MVETRLKLDNITAIICVRNSEDFILEGIANLKSVGISKIIVVDGNSTDMTASLAHAAGARVVHDEGKGLGAARNLGVSMAESELVLFVGPDDKMTEKAVDEMVEAINSGLAIACGCMMVLPNRDYLSRAVTAWRQSIIRPGFAETVGTPTLFVTKYLRAVPYDVKRRFSDDSDLFERLGARYGKRFWIVPAEAYETAKPSVSGLISRWSYYGVSDFEVFRAGVEAGWTFNRKIRSLLHPARTQLYRPLRHLGIQKWLVFLPFFLLITAVRYWAWAGEKVRNRAK